MIIPIKNNWDVQIRLEQYINYHLCLSIYSNKDNIIKQLKSIKKEVDKKVEILNDSQEGLGDESNWVYFKYIDTTKEDIPTPQKVGQEIIKLYKFLYNINFDNV